MFEIRKRSVFGGDVIYKSEGATCLNEALTEFLKSPNGSSADLCYADLRCADLYCAKLSWSSYTIISTLLKNAANKDVAKLEVAGLISIMTEWCWSEFCALDKPTEIKDWAMRTLSGWAWSDDSNVPKQLVRWCVDNGVERKPWPGGIKTESEVK